MRKFLFILLPFFIFSLFVFSFSLPAFAAPDCNATSGEICNPTGTTDFESLVTKITDGLLTIAIPIAVIMIIVAGVEFLIAGGNAEMVTRARKTLMYAVIGLAIILIGKGFIALIKDILTVKGP